jgi:hypothetical protein
MKSRRIAREDQLAVSLRQRRRGLRRRRRRRKKKQREERQQANQMETEMRS